MAEVTKSMDSDGSVAEVAYRMALDLWMAEHKNSSGYGIDPKIADWQFVYLVQICVSALRGLDNTSNTIKEKMQTVMKKDINK